MDNPTLLPLFKESLMKIPTFVRDDLKDYCTHSDPVLSMLFNGFTEKNFIKPPNNFQMYNWLNSDAVYADSGGLQMVTAGKSITPALKQQIYATQSVADFAMCFDEIPLTNTALVTTRNERSNVGNKIFEDADFAKSAEATAANIKEQVTYFKEHNAKTKVVIIVQGNTPQDMKFFFDTIASKLTEEDYEHVSGIAMADTCMGNGELESIKMLHAAHLISQDCHPAVSSHIHFLGIGSLYRLRPIIYLIRSGLLKSYKRISYDSTSHTSCFDMGLIKLDGTCRAYGTHKTRLADEVFDGVYNYFKPILDELVTYDQYRRIVFGEREESPLKFTAIRDTARELGGNSQIVAMLLKSLHTYYQIANFMKRSDDIWGEPGDNSPIGNLLHIRNERDIFQWYANFETHVGSRPIRRREETATLNTLDW